VVLAVGAAVELPDAALLLGDVKVAAGVVGDAALGPTSDAGQAPQEPAAQRVLLHAALAVRRDDDGVAKQAQSVGFERHAERAHEHKPPVREGQDIDAVARAVAREDGRSAQINAVRLAELEPLAAPCAAVVDLEPPAIVLARRDHVAGGVDGDVVGLVTFPDHQGRRLREGPDSGSKALSS
jgi:hypothetical protein